MGLNDIVVFGVQHFPTAHAAENIGRVKGSFMRERATTEKALEQMDLPIWGLYKRANMPHV